MKRDAPADELAVLRQQLAGAIMARDSLAAQLAVARAASQFETVRERCAEALEALVRDKKWDGTIRQPIELIRSLQESG